MARVVPSAKTGVEWWQAVLGVIVGGVSAQVAGLAVVLVAVVLFLTGGGTGAPDESAVRTAIEAALESPTAVGLSVLATGATLFAISWITAWLSRVPPRQALGFVGPWPTWWLFLVAPLGILALGPTTDFLVTVAKDVGVPSFGAIEGLSELIGRIPIWVALPAFALVPGLCEETMFRGLLQRALARTLRSPAMTIVLTGSAFAAYHMDPQHVLGVLPLGIYLSYLGQRSGNLALPVLTHTVNNAMAVIATVYLPDLNEPTTYDQHLYLVPGGWLVLAGIVALVERGTKGMRAMTPEPGRSEGEHERTVLHTDDMEWTESPSATVHRKRLELRGPKEAGRVTSVVRYEPGSRFPRHPHPDGEEILVLEGVFSDERADYPAGSFLLNPEGFSHAPFSEPGCILFVKLRQYPGLGRQTIQVNTGRATWSGHPKHIGVETQTLYAEEGYPETIERWRLSPGASVDGLSDAAGHELFVLEGRCLADDDELRAGSWLKAPPGTPTTLRSAEGCVLYVKRGHLG